MNELAYKKLKELSSTPDAREKAAAYIASNLAKFLKQRDKVLILFDERGCEPL